MEAAIRKTENNTTVICFEGDLDYHVAGPVREKLDQAAVGPRPRIMIHLGQVSYIDSSGIAAFVELSQKTKASGGKLVFCCLSAPVKNVFDLAKLSLFFTIADSEEEALKLTGA